MELDNKGWKKMEREREKKVEEEKERDRKAGKITKNEKRITVMMIKIMMIM